MYTCILFDFSHEMRFIEVPLLSRRTSQMWIKEETFLIKFLEGSSCDRLSS